MRVVTEEMPDARSVALGFWVGSGSRDESPEEAGASHFLEHLLFKGTDKRSARDIAEAIDRLGGEMNAYTTKEHTAFHVRVLAEELDQTVALLCDLLTEPALRATDIEAERQVILEELGLRDDEPGDLVHDLFHEAFYPDHPLGRDVLGDATTLAGLKRLEISAFFGANYGPANMVFSAAGRLNHEMVNGLVQNAFQSRLTSAAPPIRSAPTPTGAALRVGERDSEQAHILVGCAGVSNTDDRRWAAAILDSILGGGSSSRLFQEIREERGLAYSVYSFHSSYSDSGMFGAYAGTSPGKAHEVLDLLRAEMAKAAVSGVSDKEVEIAKGQMLGGLWMGLEDSGSRMARIGHGLLAYNRILTPDEVAARISAVTVADVNAVTAELLTGPQTLAVVGPFTTSDFT